MKRNLSVEIEVGKNRDHIIEIFDNETSDCVSFVIQPKDLSGNEMRKKIANNIGEELLSWIGVMRENLEYDDESDLSSIEEPVGIKAYPPLSWDLWILLGNIIETYEEDVMSDSDDCMIEEDSYSRERLSHNLWGIFASKPLLKYVSDNEDVIRKMPHIGVGKTSGKILDDIYSDWYKAIISGEIYEIRPVS